LNDIRKNLNMKKLLAFRHVAFEDLGTFAGFFSQAGYAIRYIDTATADLSEIDPAEPDILVVLGGPMGVYETAEYPYLQEEMRIIKARIAKGLPTLGICLGSQLIAAAMGARVYPGKVKEIGWAPVTVTAEGGLGLLAPLAATQGTAPAVLHWHGDTFDLPAGATLLASTEAYVNQAFSVDRHVLALQFHLEVQPGDIGAWVDGNAGELASAGIATAPLLSGENAVTSEAAWGVMKAWTEGFGNSR
jgi:GMP synthase (glutamine-hydrolysing)